MTDQKNPLLEQIQHLQERNKVLSSLLSNLHEIHWVLDRNLNLTYTNLSGDHSEAPPLEQELKESIIAFLTGQFNLHHITQLLDQNQLDIHQFPITSLLEFIQQDGSIGTWEVMISPINDDNGIITGFQGYTRDITEQQKLSKRLMKTVTLNHILLTSLDEGVLFIDYNRQIHFQNQRFTQLTTLTPEQLFQEESLPENYRIITTDYQPVSRENNPLHQAFKTRSSINNLHLGFQPSGKQICWLSLSIKAINHSEKITGLLITFKDITELILAREEAEEANHLKSSFLANMSHELRSTMNGILGFSDLLKDPSLTPKNRNQYVTIIENSGELLLKLIDDIIDLSKIEANQLSLYLQDIRLKPFMENLAIYFEKVRQKKRKLQLKLYLNYPPELEELVIHSDPIRLRQILTNLIENALKFTDSGQVEFGLQRRSEKKLEFYVSDTGCGIPPEEQRTIFKRYHQLKARQEHSNEGTGLGLAITERLISLLGGAIALKSEPGKGSTFFFTLE